MPEGSRTRRDELTLGPNEFIRTEIKDDHALVAWSTSSDEFAVTQQIIMNAAFDPQGAIRFFLKGEDDETDEAEVPASDLVKYATEHRRELRSFEISMPDYLLVWRPRPSTGSKRNIGEAAIYLDAAQKVKLRWLEQLGTAKVAETVELQYGEKSAAKKVGHAAIALVEKAVPARELGQFVVGAANQRRVK